jgi:hypothetical protein
MRTTIGGVDVSLAEKDLPEFSYSLIEAIDPSKVRGSSSTTFDIPATNSARIALGGPSMNEGTPPQQEFRIGNGSQVMFDGIAVPVEWDEDRVSVVVFGDNAEWINAAKNTRCTEVDLGFSPFINNESIEATWSNPDDRADIYPLMDYGSLATATATTNVIEDKMYPAVKVWKLIDTFFRSIGFTVKITGAFNNLWKRLIMPYNGGAVVGNPATYSVTLSLSQDRFMSTQQPPFIETAAPFDTVESDVSGYAELDGGFYRILKPDINAKYAFEFNGTFEIQMPPNPVPGYVDQLTLRAVLMQRNISTNESTAIAIRYYYPSLPVSEPFYSISDILFEADLLGDGFDYYVAWILTRTSASPTNPAWRLQAGATTTYRNVAIIGWQAEIVFDIAKSIQPGLTIGEVISDIANIFRLAVRTDQLSNTVTFGHLDDYLRGIETGSDWRNRVDSSKLPEKVLPELPDRHVFNYDLDSSDYYLVQHRSNYGRELGEGIFEVGGRDKQNEIKLKFAPTAQGVRFGGLTVPIIRDERSSALTDFYRVKPRILVYGGLSDGAWLFDGQSLTQYPRAYFIGQGGSDHSLAFGNEGGIVGTMQKHWRNYLIRISRPFFRGFVRLYDDEFMNFGFDRPRLINDGYMDTWVYVQKINAKRFGDERPVECELIPV